MDTFLEVDIDFIHVESYMTTSACGPSGTSSHTSSLKYCSAFSYSNLVNITQAMIIKMGNIVYSANTRANGLEESISWLIEISILAVLTHLRASIDDLMASVTIFGGRQG